MAEKTVLVLRGLQASGKSTFAKAWVSEAPENRLRFNNDDIRMMMGRCQNGKWMTGFDKCVEHSVIEMCNAMIKNCILNGKSLVIDNLNLKESTINAIRRTVEQYDTAGEYKVVINDSFCQVPLVTCLERNAQREAPIPEEIILNNYNKYFKNN